jgi:putative peptidoglycan lipid II flippase
VNLLIVVGGVVALLFILLAPWLVPHLLTAGFAPAAQDRTVELAQVVIVALIIMGPFAVLQAALYARRHFGAPALAAGFLHVGIIIGAIAGSMWGASHLGRLGLGLGVILGATLQILLLLPTLRRDGLRYAFVLDLRHPAVKRIFRLYLPLIPSYVGSMVLVFVDLSLQSWSGKASVTALALATTLVQFPVGLVASALSFAILPLLSAHVRDGEHAAFKETLMQGVRLGLMLMVPAAVGLIVLGHPMTALLFQHRQYTAGDATLTAVVLRNYAYQLPFVVVDQLMMFAFYARKNTLVPVLVGFACYFFYGIVAFPFYRTIGAPALAFANTLQNSMHGLILLALFSRFFGALSLGPTLRTLGTIVVATAIMAGVVIGLQAALGSVAFFSLNTIHGQLATLVACGGLAVIVYVAAVSALHVEEVDLFRRAVAAKLSR